MNRPRFLCDECQQPALIAAMQQLAPDIDVIRVGDPGAPPRRTQDPDLLVAAEALGRVLITGDRSTMPGHLINHFAAGKHTAGVILLRRNFSIARYAQEIADRWATTTADDWIDVTIYLP
jgi:hypothetical protein